MPTEKMTATQLGELADKFWKVKTKRLAADKVAKELKTEESGMDSLLIEQMLLNEISAVGGKDIVLVLNKPVMEPTVTDWVKFWEFIKDQDDSSLFEKRPGRKAIKERWEAGQVIPGVTKFPVYTMSKQGVK